MGSLKLTLKYLVGLTESKMNHYKNRRGMKMVGDNEVNNTKVCDVLWHACIDIKELGLQWPPVSSCKFRSINAAHKNNSLG